jgi:peptide/nickel transport system substrate-binding protein
MSEQSLTVRSSTDLTGQLGAAEISLDTFLQEAKRAGIDRVEAARLARAARAWPDPDRGVSPRTGGTLRVGLWLPPEGLDAAISTYRTSRLVTEQLYSTLTALDANGRPYPDLASWIEVSDDARTYTFGIRGGVRFHDGSPVTADDVAFTFNRLLELGEAYHFDPWVATLEGAQVVEDSGEPAVRIRLNQVTGPILTWLAFVGSGIVPRAAVEAGRDLVTDPIGSGPFRYDAAGSTEDVARVVRHAGGDHDAALEAIEFIGIRDDAERAAALLDGRIDLDALMTVAAWEAVDASPGHRAIATEDGRYHWLMVNCADALLADPGVRRAIAVGLDRTALAAEGFGPQAHPILGGPVPTWSWTADPDLQAFRPTGDPALARALLDASGVPSGTQIRVTASEALPLARRQAELVVGQLRGIGLDAGLDTVSPAGWGETVRRGGAFQLATSYWGSPINDPDDSFYMGFRSGARYDIGACGTARLDNLLERGRASIDQAERRSIYHDLQVALVEDLPIIPTIQPDVLRGAGRRLRGFVPLRNAQLRSLREAWLASD